MRKIFFRKIAFITLAVVLTAAIGKNALAAGRYLDSHPLYVGGNIVLVSAESVYLEKEDLNIILTPQSAEVDITYVLRNEGGAKTVEYVFPVEIFIGEGVASWEIEGIKLLDGDEEIEYNRSHEPNSGAANNAIELNGYNFPYFRSVNEYFMAGLEFAEKETKVLSVSYKTKPAFMLAYVDNKLPKNYSDIVFSYDLRTGASWGRGRAEEFNLHVDYTGIIKASGSVNLNIEGFSEEAGGIFNYSAKDFNFIKQKHITAVCKAPFEKNMQSDYLLESEKVLERIYASSVLDDDYRGYGPMNMFDGDFDTAWNTNGDGLGEYIELTLPKGVSVGIVNGYLKNENVYYNNARIKKLKVEALQIDTSTGVGSMETYEIELEDTAFGAINKSSMVDNVSIVAQGGGLIRLSVLETYPGRVYGDVCISGMYFFGIDNKINYTNNDSSKILIDDEPTFDELKAQKEAAGLISSQKPPTEAGTSFTGNPSRNPFETATAPPSFRPITEPIPEPTPESAPESTPEPSAEPVPESTQEPPAQRKAPVIVESASLEDEAHRLNPFLAAVSFSILGFFVLLMIIRMRIRNS